MPRFGKRSRTNLSQCHKDLQRLFNEVIKRFDCSIICGHRDKKAQDKAYEQGFSKLEFPFSKHNKKPSEAVDAVPYPIDWDNVKRMYYFAGYVRGIAEKLNIKIRTGADWDGDFEIKDQKFHDVPHFELSE